MKLVLVEWVDSGMGRGGWKPLDEIKDVSDQLFCKSVGWVTRESKKSIQLVPHLAGDGKTVIEQGYGDLVIPRKCIVKITVLRKKGK